MFLIPSEYYDSNVLYKEKKPDISNLLNINIYLF